MQPRRPALTEGDKVTAWLHVTCPGVGNPCFMLSARNESEFSSDILTYASTPIITPANGSKPMYWIVTGKPR